eukprot:1159211-Pelagomonas_calceolata.AAC.20
MIPCKKVETYSICMRNLPTVSMSPEYELDAGVSHFETCTINGQVAGEIRAMQFTCENNSLTSAYTTLDCVYTQKINVNTAPASVAHGMHTWRPSALFPGRRLPLCAPPGPPCLAALQATDPPPGGTCLHARYACRRKDRDKWHASLRVTGLLPGGST